MFLIVKPSPSNFCVDEAIFAVKSKFISEIFNYFGEFTHFIYP